MGCGCKKNKETTTSKTSKSKPPLLNKERLAEVRDRIMKLKEKGATNKKG
tara:strand:+ start:4762 stop:4911 length:150 start_codon:yes stop_codon:yes gene_type:complete